MESPNLIHKLVDSERMTDREITDDWRRCQCRSSLDKAPDAKIHVFIGHTLFSMVSCSDQDLICFNTSKIKKAQAAKTKKATGATKAENSDADTVVARIDGVSLGKDEGKDELDGFPDGILEG